jgi:tetratricopeptide (TPR) repeat protein
VSEVLNVIGKAVTPVKRHPRAVLAVVLVLAAIGGGVIFLTGPSRAETLLVSAKQALDRDDYARAYADLKTYLDLRPNEADIHFLAGRTARRSGAYTAALEHLRTAQKLGAPSELVTLERVLGQVQQGNLRPFEARLQQLVDGSHPDALYILEALAEGYVQTSQFDSALKALRRLLERKPNHPQGLMWQGWCLAQTLRTEDAAKMYQRALEIRDDDVIRAQYVNVLMVLNRQKEAITHYEILARRHPDRLEVLIGMATCRRVLNQCKEALRIIHDLLARRERLRPKELAHALAERGKLALAADDPQGAEPFLREALALTPNVSSLHHALANCLEQLGKEKEAAECRARHEAIENDAKVLGKLVLNELPSRPADPGLRTKIAELLLRTGRPDEAARWARSALYFDPRHQGALRILEQLAKSPAGR